MRIISHSWMCLIPQELSLDLYGFLNSRWEYTLRGFQRWTEGKLTYLPPLAILQDLFLFLFWKKEKTTGEPKDVTKDYQLIVDGEICSEGHKAPLLTSPAHLSASCEHAVASIMSDSAKPGTEACQALSMGFSRQEHWNGFPCLPPQALPDPGIEPMCPVAPALQTDS